MSLPSKEANEDQQHDARDSSPMTRCQPSHRISVTYEQRAQTPEHRWTVTIVSESCLSSPLAFVCDPGHAPPSPNLVAGLHLGHGDESERSPFLVLAVSGLCSAARS